jgi:hypothetical protein
VKLRLLAFYFFTDQEPSFWRSRPLAFGEQQLSHDDDDDEQMSTSTTRQQHSVTGADSLLLKGNEDLEDEIMNNPELREALLDSLVEENNINNINNSKQTESASSSSSLAAAAGNTGIEFERFDETSRQISDEDLKSLYQFCRDNNENFIDPSFVPSDKILYFNSKNSEKM